MARYNTGSEKENRINTHTMLCSAHGPLIYVGYMRESLFSSGMLVAGSCDHRRSLRCWDVDLDILNSTAEIQSIAMNCYCRSRPICLAFSTDAAAMRDRVHLREAVKNMSWSYSTSKNK